jgi:hypothetical protein
LQGSDIVGLPGIVPLTEAAAFTFGCAVLRVPWFNSNRASLVLTVVAAALAALLLIVCTPESICIDLSALDPAQVWPPLAGAVSR